MDDLCRQRVGSPSDARIDRQPSQVSDFRLFGDADGS